jgi:hypothetical protein
VLTTYAAETAVDRQVPNPAVKRTRAELRRLRTAVQNVRAALGRTMVLAPIQPTPTDDRPAETPSDATDQPTVRTKRAPAADPARRAALMIELQRLETEIKQTRDRLRSLPADVPLTTLGPLPQTPQLETKLIADAVKVAAYNAQSWLADRLARHYLNSNDLHDLLRSFAHLSGTLSCQADGALKICLQPPDLPLHRRALAGLCADLNLGQPVFPGTDRRLHYEVADGQPASRRRDNDRGPV